MLDPNRVVFIYEGQDRRLDLVLLDYFSINPPGRPVTRSQLKHWIEDRGVLINKAVQTRAGRIVRKGEEISVNLPEPVPSALEPWEMPLEVLYEDSELLVINKPSGLTVHPGAGNVRRTLVNALLGRGSVKVRDFDLGERPGIVHRLDKDTSGLLVVAKNPAAHASLSAQFSKHTAGRVYWALVFRPQRAKSGPGVQDSGTVDAPIGRHPSARKKMAVVPQGRKAVTNWKVLSRFKQACLLEVSLETGRTHQIRVHMEQIGYPLIGDTVYARGCSLEGKLDVAAKKFGRQALHAKKLRFCHPLSKEVLEYESELPTDFKELLAAFESL